LYRRAHSNEPAGRDDALGIAFAEGGGSGKSKREPLGWLERRRDVEPRRERSGQEKVAAERGGTALESLLSMWPAGAVDLLSLVVHRRRNSAPVCS
jgi:hypothetical protein